MKLRKKLLTLTLAAMTAFSASLAISSNAATNTKLKDECFYLNGAKSIAYTDWRTKMTTSPIHLKTRKLCGSGVVNVSTQGNISTRGLTLSDITYYSFKDSNEGPYFAPFDGYPGYAPQTLNWSLDEGEYFLPNYIYQYSNGQYGNYPKPARLLFTGVRNLNELIFIATWSPDC